MAGDCHFGIRAGLCGVHSGYHHRNVGAKLRPLLFAQHYNADFATCEILLIAEVLVRSYKQLKTGSFGSGKQLPVCEALPFFFGGRPDGWPFRKGRKGTGVP